MPKTSKTSKSYYFMHTITRGRDLGENGYEDNWVSKMHPFEVLKDIKDTGEEGEFRRFTHLVSWQKITKAEFDLAIKNGIEEWT